MPPDGPALGGGADGARRPGDAATTYADPSLAEKELGWKAEKTLDEMCRDAWNFRKLREAEK